jgi:hypothetical protein
MGNVNGDYAIIVHALLRAMYTLMQCCQTNCLETYKAVTLAAHQVTKPCMMYAASFSEPILGVRYLSKYCPLDRVCDDRKKREKGLGCNSFRAVVPNMVIPRTRALLSGQAIAGLGGSGLFLGAMLI